MSTAKHQPASPLPWYLRPQSGRDEPEIRTIRPLTQAEKDRHRPRLGNRVETETMDTYVREPQDIVYMHHTAHAYPKLVESLRTCASFLANKESDDARRLLRDLGEDA